MLCYIGFGSNLQDRQKNIETARSLLEKEGLKILRTSPVYETKALLKAGEKEQPDFLNGVFEAETDLDPEKLLDLLEKVEKKMGRSGKGDWRPRIIDLDILLYGDREMKTARLTIPHPEMKKRDFVMKPLADLTGR
jgi:2-amino-4-hydroxy-6-hydroxymethyldihydropteridine diphosphokinase